MTDTKDTINRLYGQQVRVRACGLLLGEKGILLARHDGLGKAGTYWLPPGGGVQFGESLHQAVQREFREETGLEVEVQDFVQINEFIEPPLHAIEFFFLVRATGGTLFTGTDPEIPAANQLLQTVAFLDLAALACLPPEELHPVVQGLQSWEELLSRRQLFF